MDFAGKYCIFSLENGTGKRCFQLGKDGLIVDLLNSQGHDNERFWQHGGDELYLFSADKQLTSRFKVQYQNEYYWTLIGHSFLPSIPQNIKLKITCVPEHSDLFEAKTKFHCTHLIQKGCLEVGQHTYGIPNLIDAYFGNLIFGKVIIGDYCSIAENVYFMVSNHRIDLGSTYPFGSLNMFYSPEVSIADHDTKGVITVGNDVWIGMNVMIMSGVQIGDGAVIASGAIVTKNVAPYSIVGGNPAKHLKYRIEDEQLRAKMQEIAWWNWPYEKVLANLKYIMSPDIAAFVEKFG